MTNFKIRTFGRTELAQLYCPELCPQAAFRKLEKSKYAVTANEPKNESDIPIRSISTLHWISINYEMPYIGFRFKIGACCYTCAKRHKTSIRNRSMLLQS